MGAVDIPTLQYTPTGDISGKVDRLRATFFQQKTKSIESRILRLRKLYWAIKDREDRIKEALRRDLGKSDFESYLAEITMMENDIIFVTKNLPKWAKDEKAADIDLTYSLMKPTIRKDPLGCVLIIGAFNFPFLLTFGPLIGAISGGNTVMVKPSESAPNSAVVIQEIIEAAFDPSVVSVSQGAVEETKTLLAQKWDKICFTGSNKVGRIVAQAAAPTLTPVLLELGGRNPAFITKHADLRLAARRLLWGKTFNAGQICTSQNYILADKEVVPRLVDEFSKALKEYYPKGPRASQDYCRIINKGAFHRIKAMLDNSNGKILLGGSMDEDEKFIEPTVVLVDSVDDSLITEESFGPIITILPVTNLDEAIRIANEVDSTPLALYPFGTKEEVAKVLSSVRSGGASINDSYMHVSIPTLPFGGVGESGSGCYHGRSSFDSFVHRRSITTTPSWVERVLAIRYPPYAGKLSKFLGAGVLKPNFDRQGREKLGIFGWLVWFITLGGGPNKSGAARTAAVTLG
ncbi:Hexadecenal dehydrogenase [Ophidiomyces ophidiicola]|uniref:Hexadecenal dehydrogenase n=1 Tax=Ophidiomyces ophidiicola TaxID=1387563 RepID=A0ACB8UTY3_9EURO|nr:Hexadecenal dehydrogenase [Ophidiomyces ophidiicola]KAI1909601.1 Hexadecenal dehydrogenase [Ophidiomyces ophidiicola]KAI1913077.1 Hexadecenal dehydrogenase [Ophidiomyces ophidiicola]KAI1924881.1 Hexadecenal dehydrogenase [Ophidiomyces ophidiicola]KAI1941068.1 Hexadecenal dehydrogenase [Ophidiomyces ophidiicola]KAI1943113.1 Hexadecenal dehydrogenase [Ophidiomyces ophidiicola]